MPKPVPIYRCQEETFQADTCTPLVDAAGRGAVRLEALRRGHYPGRPLTKFALPGVKTIGYWDAHEPQDWGLPWHRNEGIEITFLESGRLAFAVEEREFDLRPDAVTVTRPWQRHRVGNPGVGFGRLHWIILDVGVRRPNQSWKWPPWFILSEPDLDELTNVLRHHEQPVWKASPELRRAFQAMARAVETDRESSSASRLAVLINEVFILLLDTFRKHNVELDRSLSSSQRTVELFLADLVTHPEHLAMAWTVADMARSCGLGVTQFTRHTQVLTNMTPMQHLNHARLEMAARLLRAPQRPGITEVALGCGFASSQYFATAFGRRFGRTPRDFRDAG
jgi:AraC-like DNA-binding protein